MKQRTPFAGRGVVFRRAADELVPAIGFFDEAGSAEVGNVLAYVTEKAETDGFFNFHADRMTGWLGHWLSKRLNNCGRENQRRERGRRTVVPGLAMLTPLTFNMTFAASRSWASATFGGRICAKRPSILSMTGTLDSPRLKNFPLPLRMMGRNFCFCPLCDSPM